MHSRGLNLHEPAITRITRQSPLPQPMIIPVRGDCEQPPIFVTVIQKTGSMPLTIGTTQVMAIDRVIGTRAKSQNGDQLQTERTQIKFVHALTAVFDTHVTASGHGQPDAVTVHDWLSADGLQHTRIGLSRPAGQILTNGTNRGTTAGGDSHAPIETKTRTQRIVTEIEDVTNIKTAAIVMP
ncbi:hypothetical protein EP30_08055 [Bifidobacterium sp. UTCIF-39]|nr:hypothetical protein EP30_08055 [Bifidobacterium sp. UTCIF-39]